MISRPVSESRQTQPRKTTPPSNFFSPPLPQLPPKPVVVADGLNQGLVTTLVAVVATVVILMIAGYGWFKYLLLKAKNEALENVGTGGNLRGGDLPVAEGMVISFDQDAFAPKRAEQAPASAGVEVSQRRVFSSSLYRHRFGNRYRYRYRYVHRNTFPRCKSGRMWHVARQAARQPLALAAVTMCCTNSRDHRRQKKLRYRCPITMDRCTSPSSGVTPM